MILKLGNERRALRLAIVLQLGDVVLKAAARLNLPIGWIPGRLSEQNFDLEEPPTKSSPWVGVLLNHLRVFHQRLETLGAINQQDINQVQEISSYVQARRISRKDYVLAEGHRGWRI